MFIPSLGRSVAELDAAMKNAQSHRAQAARQMARLMRGGTLVIKVGWQPGALRLETLPPLSLYVHLPWCQEVPYCDFNSHGKGSLPRRYLERCAATSRPRCRWSGGGAS
jgi:coproporphyrinogen III oxidase-like Fe-S oxidoreductase